MVKKPQIDHILMLLPLIVGVFGLFVMECECSAVACARLFRGPCSWEVRLSAQQHVQMCEEFLVTRSHDTLSSQVTSQGLGRVSTSQQQHPIRVQQGASAGFFTWILSLCVEGTACLDFWRVCSVTQADVLETLFCTETFV